MSEEKPTKAPKGFDFDRLNTPLTFISTVLVAMLTFVSGFLLKNIDRDLQRAELDQERWRIENEQRELEEQAKREFFAEAITKIVSGDEQIQREGVVLLSVLYPNEAQQILTTINQVLPSDGAGLNLEREIEQTGNIQRATGVWGIVVGSDQTLSGAEYEVDRAQQLGYVPVELYQRGNWFVTVITDRDRATVEGEILKVRADIRDSAFIVNLNEWCPNPQPRDGDRYFECEGGA